MLLFFNAPIEREEKKREIEGVEVVNTISRALELRIVNPFVLWQFISKYLMSKIFCIYVITKNDICIHTSMVIGKGWRFPFMSNDDIQIGPCWTATESRKQGLYVAIIQRILCDFSDHQCWMICDENNIASIRGIERAGLELRAKGKRTMPVGFKIIGRFVITKV